MTVLRKSDSQLDALAAAGRRQVCQIVRYWGTPSITAYNIAKGTGIDKSAVQTVLDQMVREGFLFRATSRAGHKRYRLTEKGKRLAWESVP